jgi:hypothetical protein
MGDILKFLDIRRSDADFIIQGPVKHVIFVPPSEYGFELLQLKVAQLLPMRGWTFGPSPHLSLKLIPLAKKIEATYLSLLVRNEGDKIFTVFESFLYRIAPNWIL